MRAVKRGSEKQNPVLGASLANSKISSNHLLLVLVSHVQNRNIKNTCTLKESENKGTNPNLTSFWLSVNNYVMFLGLCLLSYGKVGLFRGSQPMVPEWYLEGL